MTHPTDPLQDFPTATLLGGPLHDLGRRLGLVRKGGNTLGIGIAIGVVLWLVGALLAVLEGTDLWSIEMLGVHTRLLLVIPLMFACESALDPKINEFVRSLLHSGILPEDRVPLLRAQVVRMAAWNNSRWVEVACLLATIALAWATPMLDIPGAEAFARMGEGVGLRWAGWWYVAVCLTIFRFLVLRWFCRWMLWVYWLWRLSRMRLQLVANHPDGMGGLGHLELVHIHVSPLVVAISVTASSSLAVEIAAKRMALEAIYPTLAAIVMIDAVLFVGPLLLFSGQMWACRVRGLGNYTVLGARYAAEFERKWHADRVPRDELLGSPDIQSMADLTGARQTVFDMRSIPISTSSMSQLLLAALLPMAPLALFKYPLAELVAQILSSLLGL